MKAREDIGIGSKARWLLTVASMLAAVTFLAVTSAHAERTQSGTLEIKVGGGIVPAKLPRDRLAPVEVLMEAAISTADRSVPPELKRISLEINRKGILQTKGLPTCSLAKLRTSTAAFAERSCAGALIGHGNASSHISFPGQGAFASNGRLLAFNGRLHGRPAILAQVTSQKPLTLNFVIPFEIKKDHGTFGSELVGKVPPIASGYGEITAIDLSLKRTYSHAGKTMSVLSASCPAAAGFPGASFTFAKTSFTFADGSELGIVLTRSCKVRN